MAQITCTHDELAFKPGKHDTVHVRCMQCRRSVTMELDRQGEVDTYLARHKINAVWQTRERLLERR